MATTLLTTTLGAQLICNPNTGEPVYYVNCSLGYELPDILIIPEIEIDDPQSLDDWWPWNTFLCGIYASKLAVAEWIKNGGIDGVISEFNYWHSNHRHHGLSCDMPCKFTVWDHHDLYDLHRGVNKWYDPTDGSDIWVALNYSAEMRSEFPLMYGVPRNE